MLCCSPFQIKKTPTTELVGTKSCSLHLLQPYASRNILLVTMLTVALIWQDICKQAFELYLNCLKLDVNPILEVRNTEMLGVLM
jgi:hypothetical protein